MTRRRKIRARQVSARLGVGYPQLTLAKFIVIAESLLRDFLRPLLIIGFFIALAWIGVFTGLYPWAHLIAFMVFFLSFFDSLGKAIASRKHISYSAAKRRVEIASHLPHRPLDTLEDHPFATEAETLELWREHRSRLEKRLDHLRWPQWMLDLSGQDPYALRQALGILLVLGLVIGWGTLGGRLINAINPDLGHMVLEHPTLSAWITPPEYTGLPPIMIATPADLRHENSVITVPEGSTITAHIAEHEGVAPELAVNDTSLTFSTAKDGGYGISESINKGTSLKIRHGWKTLGEWNIHVVVDQPPQIQFKSHPKATERHSTQIEFNASDDFGLRKVQAKITPREAADGIKHTTEIIDLSSSQSKQIDTVAYEDLTSSPWAGSSVDIALIAEDGAGHSVTSTTETFILPERAFFNPAARALIEERKKLQVSPTDISVRNEAANIMAGIAQQPTSYGHDPVTLMSLRGGAVRLVLNKDDDLTTIQDIMWQAALRIEEGATGQSEKALRQAQKELSQALERNAPEAELHQLIDRLQQAMSKYLSELQTRMAATPNPSGLAKATSSTHRNILTPDILKQRIDALHDLAAGGARDEAQQMLSNLREMMENLRTQNAQLSPEQMRQIEALKSLSKIKSEQQSLLNSTQTVMGGGRTAENLPQNQSSLREQTLGLSQDLNKKTVDSLALLMSKAASSLHQRNWQHAIDIQQRTLKEIEGLEASLKSSLKASLESGEQGTSMNGADPFGQSTHGQGGSSVNNDQITLPTQTKMQKIREILNDLRSRSGDSNRPQTERDYINRLLEHY